MSNKLLLLLSLIFFMSCKGQKNLDTITIHVTNRSHNPIDSIIVPYKQIKVKEGVGIGKTFSINIDVNQLGSYSEGYFPIFIYQKERKFIGQFGFHDWGTLTKKEEHVYLFDKGINYKDEALKKPVELQLFIIPKTSLGIDSVVISQSALKKKNVASTFTELLLDYESFEKAPEIKIYQNGRSYILKIDHDWDNWNYNQEFIYVLDNGIFPKKEI